jgi:hypothetical protein
VKKQPFGREGVDEELQFHFDRLVDDLIASGLTPSEARERPAQRLGNLDDVRAQCAAIEARRDPTDRSRRWIADLRAGLAACAAAARASALHALTLTTPPLIR